MRLTLHRLATTLFLTAIIASTLEAQTARRTRLFPVPVLGYAPETSLMFGLALVGVNSPDSGVEGRPSTLLATTIYTLKNQYSAGLMIDRWTAGDLWRLTGSLGVERYPSEFNGLGASATSDAEIYTPQRLTFTAAALRRVAPHLYAGGGWAIRDSKMVSLDSGGRLAPGTIPGSRGGTPAMLTIEGDWDSRDALYRTRSGAYLRLAWGVAGRAVGSDFAFRRYTADARWYHALGPQTVVAAQAVFDATTGTVPFDLLPHLGGSEILRGYTQPRYTDGAMSAAQAELRGPLKGIFSYTLFAGAGAAALRASDLPRATLRPAGGAGLRILLDRKNGLQLRIDYALAPGAGGMYIGAGDAF